MHRPHSTPGRTGEEKITATARNRTPNLCLSIPHLLTTQTEKIYCSTHIFRPWKVNMWKVSNFASQFSVPCLPPLAPVYVTITSQKWWSHTLSTYCVQSRNSQTPRLPQQALTHVAPKSNQTAGADILTFMRLAVERRQKRRPQYAGLATTENFIPTAVLLRHSDLGFNTTVRTDGVIIPNETRNSWASSDAVRPETVQFKPGTNVMVLLTVNVTFLNRFNLFAWQTLLYDSSINRIY